MELLLWRWSTAVQVTSVLMIAVFFTVLARSVPRAEVRWWSAAWLGNLLALGTTLYFWFLQPGEVVALGVRGIYVGSKLAFVLMLLAGTYAAVRPGEVVPGVRTGGFAILVYGVFGAVFLRSIPLIGVAQHIIMGVLLLAAGVLVIRARVDGAAWLAAGLLARGALAMVEFAAYLMSLAPGFAASSGFSSEAVATFLATHSSFDVGAEWLIALGCVLAVNTRAQQELRQTNQDLLDAQENLRGLADRDPLTGLANRRGLAEVFRASFATDTALIFFDLDGFKQINDRYGHKTGDECLRTFATSLREAFRPSDSVVRYAGDEFLVVAPGLAAEMVEQRLEALRERLTEVRLRNKSEWSIEFSAGVDMVPPGGDSSVALQAADASMYEAKRVRKESRKTRGSLSLVRSA